jgi:hypothetical protein
MSQIQRVIPSRDGVADPSLGYDIVISDAELNRNDLVTRADAALQANAVFLALAAPTNAQTLTQVQRLTKQSNALIRLVINELDDIAGT